MMSFFARKGKLSRRKRLASWNRLIFGAHLSLGELFFPFDFPERNRKRCRQDRRSES
jgi:hypothetical protein